MSCPEFITHPKRSTDLFNITQTRKIHYKQSRKKFCDEPYKTELTQTTYFKQWQEYFYLTFMTAGIRNFMAQQKQCKQLILIDTKNIFTYCFQPIQRLQPNIMTDSRRTSIISKNNGSNWQHEKFHTYLTPKRKNITWPTKKQHHHGFH